MSDESYDADSAEYSDDEYLEMEHQTLSTQIEVAYQKIGVTRSHVLILALLLLGVFFDSLEQNTVGITGPVLREYWGLDTGAIGFLNTITFTMTALGRILSGAIADRIGRRSLLISNLTIFAGGSLLCALAPSYAILAFGRAIVGLGLGGEIAVAVVMTSEFFSIRSRGTAVGLINVTAAGFGNMLAPLFGVLCYTFFPGGDRWRWVFGLLFVPVLLVIYFRRYVPETPRFLVRLGRVDEANKVISRLSQSRLHGDVEVFPYLREPPYTHLAEDEFEEDFEIYGSRWDIFRGKYLRRTLALCVAVASSYAAQFAVLTLMATVLVSSGYEINASLRYTTLMQSGSLVGAIVAALVAGRMPRKRVLTIAAAIGLVAAGTLAIFTDGGIGLIMVCGWVFNFAVIISNTTIWLFAPENYPTRVRGFGTALILAVGALSGGLSPLLTGKIFDRFGLNFMFGSLALAFVLVVIAISFIPETFGRAMEEDDE